MGKPGMDYWGTIGGHHWSLIHSFAKDNLVTSAPFLDPISSYGTSSAEDFRCMVLHGRRAIDRLRNGLCSRARMYGRRLSRIICQEKKGPKRRGDVSSKHRY